MIVDRPLPFGGTQQQAITNFETHQWTLSGNPDDADVACWRCDAKPWDVAAAYPCGEDPPREVIDDLVETEVGDEFF